MWSGNCGVYLIAEIGGNHEGDFEYAKKLTQLACKSGVDAVKFQIYTGNSLVNPIESPERHKHFRKFELEPGEYVELAKICQMYEVEFAASVWDIQALEWIEPYMNWYKIGSGDLTSHPILKKITSLGKPIILSTGLATLSDVRESITFIQACDKRYRQKKQLALLQCTSMYPIPDDEANLSVIETFKKEFQLTIGYSDHTVGSDALEVAVAMGAEILEMHFTDSRENKLFRDHKVSLTSKEIQQLIQKIKKIKLLQGHGNKAPTPAEIEANHITSFHRAIYPSQDIEAGTIINENNICVLRPNTGIDAKDWEKLIGKRLKTSKLRFEKLQWSDFS